jgi:hypothetical protein
VLDVLFKNHIETIHAVHRYGGYMIRAVGTESIENRKREFFKVAH